MWRRQDYHEEGQRQQQNETRPPPSYAEAMKTTSSLQQDDLQASSSPLLPIGSAWQAAPLTTARFMEPSSLERTLSERQHAPELCPVCGKALTELKGRVGTTEMTSQVTLRQYEATENQRRLIEAQKRSLEDKNRTLESRKRRLEDMQTTIKSQRSIIENQELLIGYRDRSIQRLRDELQSMSARVAAAEALPRKEKE